MAETFQAMTGLSAPEAAMWMEMAGGNVEVAVGLFFGGGGGAAPKAAPPSLDVPDWFTLVWPKEEDIPDFWINQGLTFDDDHKFGLVQAKNGPCGLLAAVQAELVKQAFHSEMQSDDFGPDCKVTDEVLASALATIISRCRSDEKAPFVLADWKDANAVGKQVSSIEVNDAKALPSTILAALPAFKRKGGAVLLLYSCLLTRGIDTVRKDLASASLEPPLIVGRFWLCSFEMQSLLMRGTAQGNIGAFNPLAPTNKIDWKEDTGVGLLSKAFEKDSGMPVCDRLMSPSTPIWIIHGGDHFTTMFSPTPIDDSKGKTFTLYLWNGLPPGGPRMTTLTVTAPNGPRGPAPEKHSATFYKPVPGQIDGIIQANPEDKKARPDEWKTWRYEVVLAFDDPSVEGAERPADMPLPKVFEQGPVTPGRWRCTRCYADRFKTMNFSTNPENATSCEGCHRPRAEAGWSIWMTYDQLTPGWQSTVLDRNAPKILSILNNKWPGCQVTWDGDTKPAV